MQNSTGELKVGYLSLYIKKNVTSKALNIQYTCETGLVC